jgi:hypothetical protein
MPGPQISSRVSAALTQRTRWRSLHTIQGSQDCGACPQVGPVATQRDHTAAWCRMKDSIQARIGPTGVSRNSRSIHTARHLKSC